MRVRVLYFAAVREIVACEDESVDLPAGVRSVADFARWIALRRPALAGRMQSVRIARNETFARDVDEIVDGDVLALIPPVAGG
jgi:molybdopterin converting factor subunit 1